MWITEDIKSLGLSSGNFSSGFSFVSKYFENDTRSSKYSSWWMNKVDCCSTPLESSNTLTGKWHNLAGIGIDSNYIGCETVSRGSEVEVEASSIHMRE